MTDDERITALLWSMAGSALEVGDDLSKEPGATAAAVFAAMYATAFHLGVVVGLSDIGPRVLAGLDRDVDMSEGLAEFRAVLS